MTTPARSTWLKMPTDNPTSKTVFWINTLDDEILRQVHDATSEPGELSNYFNPPPAMTREEANRCILTAPEIPALPPADSSTVTDLQRYGHALNHYQIRNTLYKEQRAALNYIKEQLIACMDPCTLQLVFPDRSVLLTLSSPAIYNLLWQHFSAPTQALIDPINHDLSTPFTYSDANSFDAHVAKFLGNLHALEYMLIPLNMNDKCNRFRKTLSLSSEANFFNPFLVNYDVSHPSLASQDLPAMISICRSALSSIVQNHADTQLTYHTNMATASAPKKPRFKPRTPPTAPTNWCWTHGPTFHSSSKCKNPAAGHQTAATESNKMGSNK